MHLGAQACAGKGRAIVMMNCRAEGGRAEEAKPRRKEHREKEEFEDKEFLNKELASRPRSSSRSACAVCPSAPRLGTSAPSLRSTTSTTASATTIVRSAFYNNPMDGHRGRRSST